MTITPKPIMAHKDHAVELDQMEEVTNKPYPKAVFFIVVTEFCERFSYYGMRAVLTIYMRNILNFSEDLSTTIYHVFLMLCYGLPVFGGIIADNFLGKYKTIVAASIIFTLGNFVLTLSSVPPVNLPTVPLCIVGLLLMGIGTSGIKPCVCPLGGEQFRIPGHEKELKQFFSLFVFTVSIGSMVSTVITPVLRRDVECFGQDTCYPLAFGIPSILMIVAIVVFTLGKKQYTIKNPEDNIIVKVTKCISFAASQKFKNRSKAQQEKKKHFLDYAGSKYDASLIKDTKGFLRVLVYYLPVPMFFALYEQLGSRWTLQATRMNGEVGNFMIKPDQMQVANAVLMFVFIPVFETLIYPIFHKCNLLKRPLQRMGVGGVLAAISFLLAGIVETSIENSTGHFSGSDAHLNFINTSPCPVALYNIETNSSTFLENRVLVPAQGNLILHFPLESKNFPLKVVASENSCGNFTMDGNALINLVQGELKTVLISRKSSSLAIDSFLLPEDVKKSKEGNAKLRFISAEKGPFLLNLRNNDENLLFNLSSAFTNDFDHDHVKTEYNEGLSFSKIFEIKPSSYEISTKGSESTKDQLNILNSRTDLLTGGSYLCIIYPSQKLETIIITPPNSVHMLWLLPQYVLMAWAEVLYIISGIEFSFTEAPESMKSVLQSCWHLANAAGNLIVIISAQLSLGQKYEFFGFSTLMILDVIFFTFLAMKYKYVSSESKISLNTEKVEETFC